MNREIKALIIDKLRQLDVYYPSDDGVEHTVRCPFCGDSKTLTHAHMGIMIDPSNDDLMIYHCFRCGVGGRFTDDTLTELGIHLDESEVRELRNFNKKAAKLSKRTIVHTERYSVPISDPSIYTTPKLNYVNNRLGLALDYEGAARHKIVLSLYEFMVHNELKRIEGLKRWMYDVLEKDYVGFLSTNNNLITFRNINPESKGKRYVKVFINPLNPDEATFYSIPTQLNLLYTEDLHLHIAEGTFDILSIKHNLSHDESGHHIFYASCGYSYMAIIKHLVRNGIASDINLHIYADKDKSDSEHRAMLRRNNISAFLSHVYLHRNQMPNEKDYGVSQEKIKDGYRKLW